MRSGQSFAAGIMGPADKLPGGADAVARTRTTGTSPASQRNAVNRRVVKVTQLQLEEGAQVGMLMPLLSANSHR
jgi:hypothetical protein